MRILSKIDVAVLRIAKDGCCTYCHRQFGSWVTWHSKTRFLEEVREHIIPRVSGGTIIVPSCQICNSIKSSLLFSSLDEIQTYCLDKLLKDRSVTLVYAMSVCAEKHSSVEELEEVDVDKIKKTENAEKESRLIAILDKPIPYQRRLKFPSTLEERRERSERAKLAHRRMKRWNKQRRYRRHE